MDEQEQEQERRVILVIGSCGLDRLLSVATYPSADAKVRTTAYHEVGGGNAGNTATAMAMVREAAFLAPYNLCVKLFTKVGDDYIGKQLEEELDSAGVDVSSPLFKVGDAGTTTGFTTVVVSESEQTRTCIHTPGSCGELNADDLSEVDMDEIFENAVHLHSDARHTDVALLLAKEARKRGISVSLDVEKDRNTEALDALLAEATIVFTNSQQVDDYLVKLTSGFEKERRRKPLIEPVVKADADRDGLSSSEVDLYARAIRPNAYFTRWYQDLSKEKQVVITKGSMGALQLHCESLFCVESESNDESEMPSNEIAVSSDGQNLVQVRHRFVDQSAVSSSSPCKIVSAEYAIRTAGILPDATVVDTTGAGDACIGGFLMARQVFSELSNNKDVSSSASAASLAFGCWVGGRKLGGPGARTALPTAADVDEILGTEPEQVRRSLERILTPFRAQSTKS